MGRSTQKGGCRVGSAMSQLSRHGYRCGRLSASGQRRGKRREERGLDGDIVALTLDEDLPHLLVEVGGDGKRVAQSFREMLEHPLPQGYAPLVGRVVKRRWRWYVSPRAKALRRLSDVIAVLKRAAQEHR